ncbi:hypothetical protein B0H13DRAFT_2303888 [Mycena leptocephala]|nr:hypothetical protein B0H13DRAFT_2303888 [Mycena leptocephala]
MPGPNNPKPTKASPKKQKTKVNFGANSKSGKRKASPAADPAAGTSSKKKARTDGGASGSTSTGASASTGATDAGGAESTDTSGSAAGATNTSTNDATPAEKTPAKKRARNHMAWNHYDKCFDDVDDYCAHMRTLVDESRTAVQAGSDLAIRLIRDAKRISGPITNDIARIPEAHLATVFTMVLKAEPASRHLAVSAFQFLSASFALSALDVNNKVAEDTILITLPYADYSSPEIPDSRPGSLPPAERLSSPFTPTPANSQRYSPLKTYQNCNKRRAKAWAATMETEAAAERLRIETAKKTALRKKAQARILALRLARSKDPERRSRHTRRGRRGDNTDHDVFLLEQLLRAGNQLHVVDRKPRPFVDRNDVVMGVVAGGPKGNAEWWDHVTQRVFGDMARLYRNGDFSDLGERESRVRFGVGYGEEYAVGVLEEFVHVMGAVSIEYQDTGTSSFTSLNHFATAVGFKERALSVSSGLLQWIDGLCAAALEDFVRVVNDVTKLHGKTAVCREEDVIHHDAFFQRRQSLFLDIHLLDSPSPIGASTKSLSIHPVLVRDGL